MENIEEWNKKLNNAGILAIKSGEAMMSFFRKVRNEDEQMTYQRQLKLETNKSFDGWDWTEDGRFPYPRVKGKNKKARSKYRRTLDKRVVRKQYTNHSLGE